MKTTFVVNNVPPGKVDATMRQLRALGYKPVIKVPEEDGEFTVIGYQEADELPISAQ